MPSRPLNEAEITQVLDALPTLRDKTLFYLGIKTGFRISELLSLCVSDVSVSGEIRDTLTVRRCNMKGKRSSRTVPLHPGAKVILKQYVGMLKADDKLFPITRQHAWRVIKTAARALRLKGNVSTHSMRKTLGMSVYTRSGNNLKAAQLALGHQSIASTGMYLSVESDLVDNLILTS